jgi:hypothetical protein
LENRGRHDGCVIVRPFNLLEFIWAVAGAALLLVLGLKSACGFGRGQHGAECPSF